MYRTLAKNQYNKMPHIIEGEIIAVEPNKQGMSDSVRYRVRAFMENGSITIFTGVREMTPFGGISDYFRRRARATGDDLESQKAKTVDQAEADATIGERVYVAFVNGDITNPIIVGYKQHPNQTEEFGNAAVLNPQAIIQYLGIRVEIDPEGQMRVIHKGAPKVEFAPKNGGVIGAVTSFLSGTKIRGNNNPAITPKSNNETTIFEMLNGGVFRVRDANGQIIELDRKKSKITIANQSLKSTEAESLLGEAISAVTSSLLINKESIILDDEEKSITIASRSLLSYNTNGNSKYLIKGNEDHKNIGNVTWKIGGDRSDLIGGSEDLVIAGNQSIRVAGKQDTVVIQGISMLSPAGIIELTGSGGARVKIGNGQVGIGGPGAELLDIIDKTHQTLAKLGASIASLTVVDSWGYITSTPVNTPEFLKFVADINILNAQLISIKGGV